MRTVVAATLAAALTLPSVARADARPGGSRLVRPTFELQGIAEHADHVFVVFPYMSCDIGVEHFRDNPQLDVPVRNYLVPRPGERYDEPKFCSNGRFYAIEAGVFATAEVVLDQDLDFYRKKGMKLTILPDFEAMKTSEKRDFLRKDPRARRSDVFVDFPMLARETEPIDATLDVFRVAEVSAKSLRIEGVKVVVSAKGKPDREEPYVAGKRPDLGGAEYGWPYSHADSETDEYEEERSARRRPFVLAGMLLGAAVLAAVATVVARRRKRP